MFKKVTLTLLLSLSLSLLASVEEVNRLAHDPDATEEERDAALLSAQKQLANPSLYNRRHKNVTLTAGAGFNYSEESVSLKVGFFLSDNQVLSLAYHDLDEDDNYRYDNEKGFAVELAFKQFSGNSFYVQPFAFYRKHSEEDSLFLFSSDKRFHEIEDAGLGVKIGNQWQWDNLTVGCDWFGVGRRVVTIDETGDKNVIFSSSNDRTHYTLLNVYMGVSF